ncbi:MAG: hypothetical protein HYS17_06205 [Micavibrio aeruginosavorus]|uniref:Uncharacterized protein n=1 Tax=Micavibrio aeruginosavorus TaxID=349221 RepID=A0A7T5UH26_9BACT|nr:MAG: hypothetical protein HYS17_06205 [Micavibrio aeruginosavorus]
MANEYCKGSKLSDPEFEVVLYNFLDGKPSTYAQQSIEREIPTALPPTVKTVGRHYDRIGIGLFLEKYNRQWLEKHPSVSTMKKFSPPYIKALDRFVDVYHFAAIDPDNDDIEQPPAINGKEWRYSRVADAYRQFSKERYGIRRRSAGHLALATYRTEYHSEVLAVKGGKTLHFTKNDLMRLYEDARRIFRNKPC